MDTRKKILVVDDEQINLEFFDVMLTKLGFAVLKAENGQEALDSIRRLHPDLIILDNVMPKLSGWEVTRIVKSSPEYAEFSDTPIIMFSALDDVKDKVEGLELGADDYITKPFNFAEVLARIRAVLRSHELLGELSAMEAKMSGIRKFFAQHENTLLELRNICGDTKGDSPDGTGSVVDGNRFEEARTLLDKALHGMKTAEKLLELEGPHDQR